MDVATDITSIINESSQPGGERSIVHPELYSLSQFTPHTPRRSLDSRAFRQLPFVVTIPKKMTVIDFTHLYLVVFDYLLVHVTKE